MKRVLSLLLLLSLLLIPTTAYAADEESEYFSLDISAAASDGWFSPVSQFSLPETGSFDGASPGYGAQLEDAVALAAYEALETQLFPDVEYITIDLSGMDITDWNTEVYPAMMAAVAAYVFDHPECQYCSITGYGRSGSIAAYTVTHRADAQARKDALDAVLADFAASFDTTQSELEQYKAIHDYVCELASYNYKAAASGVQSEAHSAYGLLVDGDKVVCEGYAKSFKVLCDAVGLPCMLAVGEAVSTGSFSGRSNHMWNLVRLDEQWYAVDTTWDDVDGYTLSKCPNMELSMVCYDYFLNNTPFLEGAAGQDHRATGNIYFANEWPMAFSLPELADGQYAAVSTDAITLTFLSSDLTIPEALWRYTVADVPMHTIRDLTLRLSQDVTLDAPITVPAGWSYTLDSSDGLYSISRAAGFDSPLFTVNGALELTADLYAPDLCTIAADGTLTVDGDVETDELVMSAGTLNITGELHGCVAYQGGTLTVGGVSVSEDRHYIDTYVSDDSSHVGVCLCGEQTVNEAHTDLDSNLKCDVCSYPVIPEHSSIQSITDGTVTFQTGRDVTSVILCVAGYENSCITDIRFETISVSPGETVSRSTELLSGNFKCFLLDAATLAPLCASRSSSTFP